MRGTSYRRTTGVPASREALWPVRAIAARRNPQNRGGVESGRPQLSQVVVAGGRRPDGRLDELACLAAAIQQQRKELHGSPDEISRASALLAALWLDPAVAQAAQGVGLSAADWADAITAPPKAPTPLPEPTTALSEGTESALTEWLSSHAGAGEVGIADVAEAVATSAAGPRGGRLAERLDGLGVRPQRLVDALAHASDQLDLQEFSASVRNLRSAFGSAEVTALEIARALQAGHPGYGGGRFESLDLGPAAETAETGATAETAETAAVSSQPPAQPPSQARS